MKKLIMATLALITAVVIFIFSIHSVQDDGVAGTQTSVFRFVKQLDNTEASMQSVRKASVLSVDFGKVREHIRVQQHEIELAVPLSESEVIILDLKRSYPLSDDFVLSEKSNGAERIIEHIDEGIHFSGKIRGVQNSLAAVSFFSEEVIGIISDERGNFNLGELKNDNGSPTGKYVIYNDADLLGYSGYKCGVEGLEEKFSRFAGKGTGGGTKDNPLRLPVKVYFEADYQTYLDRGSDIQNVANFISGFYNSVQAIYQAEGIPTQVSQVGVWTAADPYRNLNQSDTILFAFGQNTRDNFQGNLAHLVSTRSGGLGGIAWIGILCLEYQPNYFGGRFAFSNIENNFNNFPTYSWTINCVTHEMGHNLGSRHTHSCTWPTGNGGALGAIDSCYNAEGGCFPTPRPRIGTIMSYCHLWPANQGGGVNLGLGFGQLPGDTIRLRYAQALCLDREMNSSERPSGFQLAQNHPNPFNPSTVISFAVPEVSNVTLSIYDMSGKLITELISSELYEPGFYDISFNATAFGLSSGIYFYRMQAGGYVETKRMAMVK